MQERESDIQESLLDDARCKAKISSNKQKDTAIAFANFVGNRPLPEYSQSTNNWRWWNNDTRTYNFGTTEELYDQFIKENGKH